MKKKSLNPFFNSIGSLKWARPHAYFFYETDTFNKIKARPEIFTILEYIQNKEKKMSFDLRPMSVTNLTIFFRRATVVLVVIIFQHINIINCAVIFNAVSRDNITHIYMYKTFYYYYILYLNTQNTKKKHVCATQHSWKQFNCRKRKKF